MKKTALIAICLSVFFLVNLAWGGMLLKKTTKLAESGNINAQYNIGLMYYNGDGVPKNVIKAYVWWSIASANGDEDSKEWLEELRTEMTPQQISQAQNEAAELWKRIDKSKK
jgi:TPR repeat protein